MKSSKPSPSTSEAAGEVKILLSFCLPSSLMSHSASLAPPPSPPPRGAAARPQPSRRCPGRSPARRAAHRGGGASAGDR